MNHYYIENSFINFSKLESRLLTVNDPLLGHHDIRNVILSIDTPTLLLATGGSRVVAHFLKHILESNNVICEVIEPRDYFYKKNIKSYNNLIVISCSGKTNGINECLNSFNGNKYLITEEYKENDYNVLSWSNSNYDKEKSFISLTSSIAPITLLLDIPNEKVKELLKSSKEKIDSLDVDFKNINLIQIISGYDTNANAYLLESNLIETGVLSVVIHDKGSFCHGRSNLLFNYPNSKVIYLVHDYKELDNLIINLIKKEYNNILVFGTNDLNDSILVKEYYLMLQMYYLSNKIASDKGIDITMPEYNPRLVKKLYNYKGEM